jgi:hypothetical protein
MSGPAIGRSFAACAALLAFISPAAAKPRPFDAWAVPDPAEAAAPADANFTAACQTGIRERFGRERVAFGQPSHTARGDTRILRLDLTVGGDPFRAVCAREARGGAVETVVFAGATDGTGPRVVVLGGPPSAMRPRGSTDSRIVARDPSRGPLDDSALYPGYGGSYLPGLWAPDGAPGRAFDGRVCRGCRVAVVNGTRVIFRADGTVVAIASGSPRFIERVPGSSAPFSSGGIASPAIGNFPQPTVRSGSIGLRSGGGRAAIGSFGR